jgi:AraC family transcriptional regulator
MLRTIQTEGTYLRGGLPPCVVRQVCEYIDSNLDQRIKVGTLARLANLSVWYFLRAFKQSLGVSPHHYLARRRLERAKELLSDMPLSQIALAAGFADQSHCARRFRQHVGMSPRDYRRGGRKSERRWRWLAAGRMPPSGP